jgi:hypothetical protein
MPASFYTNKKTRHDRLPLLATATSSSRSSPTGGPSDPQSKARFRNAAEQAWHAEEARDDKTRVLLKRVRDMRHRVWKEGNRLERRLDSWREAQKNFSDRLGTYMDNMGSWRMRSWGVAQVDDQAAVVKAGKWIEKRQKDMEYALKTVETILEEDIEDMEVATPAMIRLTSGQCY